MKVEIKSITPVRPNGVGELRYEFRVELALGEQQENVDMTAGQMTDFRQFQQIVLAKTGILPDLGLADTNNEFDAYRHWQQTLQNSNWVRESEPNFDAVQPSDSDEDSSDPFYGFAEDD
jgi:hypothetical protein